MMKDQTQGVGNHFQGSGPTINLSARPRMIKHADAKSASDETVSYPPVNECRCPRCLQAEDHPEKQLHYQLNLLLSHLSEQQRRWVAAYEAKHLGWGGKSLVSLITGLSRGTIIRGQQELDKGLGGAPLAVLALPVQGDIQN
jgi:hypothetical protein